MTDLATGVERGRGPRWIVVALVGSLALNLIVIGASAGSLLRHRLAPAAVAAPNVAPNLLGYAGTLSPERHKELWNRTEEERRIVHPLRRDLREAREQNLKALVAEPFDQQRYAASQMRLLEADQKARAAVYRLYGEIAVNLTPEERRAYLRWREKRRPPQNLLDAPDYQANERKKR